MEINPTKVRATGDRTVKLPRSKEDPLITDKPYHGLNRTGSKPPHSVAIDQLWWWDHQALQEEPGYGGRSSSLSSFASCWYEEESFVTKPELAV
ncbi:hypothetical protein CRG98_027098 [Punica granatum]|uniref:Uncharacterized protein n=1 Tax=Punica granatum TaxID=22663 RepID=A0A2I0JA14_PUNGR|nr:hypothetical protein CRG98_027098 [Punica granatum]